MPTSCEPSLAIDSSSACLPTSTPSAFTMIANMLTLAHCTMSPWPFDPVYIHTYIHDDKWNISTYILLLAKICVNIYLYIMTCAYRNKDWSISAVSSPISADSLCWFLTRRPVPQYRRRAEPRRRCCLTRWTGADEHRSESSTCESRLQMSARLLAISDDLDIYSSKSVHVCIWVCTSCKSYVRMWITL